MAKKSRKRRTQARGGVPGLLQEAMRRLRQGRHSHAIRTARKALNRARAPAHQEAAAAVLAEVHLHAALAAETLGRRLEHLNLALEHAPQAPRPHFYRGLTLWQQGRREEGLEALDAAAERDAQQPGLAALRRLARLTSGAAWDTQGLPDEEERLLRRVAAFVEDEGAEGETAEDVEDGLWQALLQMQADEDAAPEALLQEAAGQSDRAPVRLLLRYYRGVAARRRGDGETAEACWQEAVEGGLAMPWLTDNMAYVLRQEVIGLAEAGQWREIAALAQRAPEAVDDRILAETVGLAYHHLGYEAARAGRWDRAARYWQNANDYHPTRHVAQNLALAEERRERWAAAAEAWRDMARRRPRSPDHPDYLPDGQVAALWHHAAACYLHEERFENVLTCLDHALNYAPDNTDVRMRRADVLLADQRREAAENELERLLERDPEHVEALTRLATLAEDSWHRDAPALWRRVLAADPDHREARDALAEHYIEEAEGGGLLGRLTNREPAPRKRIKVFKKGLDELPEHPRLLLALAKAYRAAGDSEAARAHLQRAHEAAPSDLNVIGPVLHELLHFDAEQAVEALLEQMRQMKGLLPSFWLDQADEALACALGASWAERFFAEAEGLLERPYVEAGRASLLVQMYEIAYQREADALAARIKQRIREEAPAGGAPEDLEAHRLVNEEENPEHAVRLLRKAQRRARKARDEAMRTLAEEKEILLSTTPSELMQMMMEMMED